MATDFYGEYLRDLAALDEFLGRHRRVSKFVEHEDPDVRRLVESLAFFSARTREAATAELRLAVSQMTRGLLDDFMIPQPARLMLRARARPGLVEAATLPRGTTIRVDADDGKSARFSTMRALTIRPLELDRAIWQPRSKGARVLLRLRAFGPSYRLDTPVSIQVALPGDDYPHTRAFFDVFETALSRVGVVYETPPATDELGLECQFLVGGILDSPDSAASMRHEQHSSLRSGTVARIREFFHFPTSALTFDVMLAPPESTRTWRLAWICLDFDEWPEGQQVNPDMFRLHMVPIENLFTADAKAIKADGTRSRFEIVAGQPTQDVVFHSIYGVSQETPAGVEPLLPEHLATADESWSLEYENDDETQPILNLRIPRAFLEPRLITVGARWYQPEFDNHALGKLTAKLQDRHVDGSSFEIVGRLAPHRESPLWRDASMTLHVLSRRSKWELSREDLVVMMMVLGADRDSQHGEIASLLRRVEAHDAPAMANDKHGGVLRVYEVGLAEQARSPELRGLVRDYLGRAEQLLDAWSNNPAVVREEVVRARPQLRSVS
jgi:type VI secretion system protein ImpG